MRRAPTRFADARRAAARPAALLLALLLAACVPAGDEARAPAGTPDGDDGSASVVRRLRLAGSPLGAPLPRPDFVLPDTSGRPFDFHAETAGRLTVLFFGYTSCPDICPVHLANLAAALDRVPTDVRREVAVVFVGVDPERDTPEQVRAWLDKFDTSFVGLTGTPAQLAAAQLAAAVPPAFVDDEWEDGYTVSHAAWILVYTQDDQAHLRYPFGIRQSQWAHDLEILAREGWPTS